MPMTRMSAESLLAVNHAMKNQHDRFVPSVERGKRKTKTATHPCAPSRWALVMSKIHEKYVCVHVCREANAAKKKRQKSGATRAF